VRVADFHYDLPADRIAQQPARDRDGSRLLVLHRENELVEHRDFRDLPRYLRHGDVLVLNNSRVIRARLRGVKAEGGGRIEILLAEEVASNEWWVMLRPGKRVRAGTHVELLDLEGKRAGIAATLEEKTSDGLCRVKFAGPSEIFRALDAIGEVPLPPYIVREPPLTGVDDRARYQTVFAAVPGSVAAPTAGLHFTEALLTAIRGQGVEVVFVTLHVGLGTFAPVKADRIESHSMHEERFEIDPAAAQAVTAAKAEGRRVIAVGTTTARVLEHQAARNGEVIAPGQGTTRLFVHPPYTFRVVDALITNFHLPESTLLMLVSAFASPGENRGRELVLGAYAEAIQQGYRFFSYGDAMLLL
jgi:S-adenosylmethionine:tRNA ribosyltransferase-isomerase